MRLLTGLLVALIGSVVISLHLLGILHHSAWWFAAGGLLAIGVFMIYEGLTGWCALRAMGIRTKI